jgi:Carbohydrate binding module (family 35)
VPAPAAAGDAVTQIMPIIAAWPDPGEEPPPPPNLWFAPIEAAEPAVRGVATVDTNASTVDESTETLIGEVVDERPGRPGPVALESDSWEDPATTVPRPEPAGPGGRVGSPKLWIAVGVALAALIAAIAIPFALGGDDDPAPPEAAGRPTALDEPGQISAESSGPAATPLATAAAAAPSPSPAPQTSGPVPGEPAPTTPTSTANPPAPPPPFAPVSFEAENGTRTGSATIWVGYPNASGGQLVRNIGNWGGTAGTLRINNVNILSTGAYTITIYYVHPDGEVNRSATVTVSGNPALNVSFTGNATCCQTKVLSNITISAGTHTITFANPTSHAPSIDRVVISRP